MDSIISKITTVSFLIVGAGLWVTTAKDLDVRGKFDFVPNVATVKGSPYGKVLALAMQAPIDFYEHDGRTGTDFSIYNKESKAGRKSTAGYDDHRHGHHENGEEHGHEHGHEHGDSSEAQVVNHEVLTWHQRAKLKIETMGAFSRRRTSPGGGDSYRGYLQSVMESKLKFAYELDPTNYVNYGNYSHFLSVSSLGRSSVGVTEQYKDDIDVAFGLSKATLALCKRDAHDPASWITASAAAYDMAYYMEKHLDLFDTADVKSALAEFDFCIKRHYELLINLQESNPLTPIARLDEMIANARFLSKLRESYGIYMQRKASNLRS